MNKQISAPRGGKDKNKEMGIREFEQQLPDPRKPSHWEKLRLTCEPRQNGTDTFDSQHLGTDISASKKQTWQYYGRKCSYLLHSLLSKHTQTENKFFLQVFECLCTTTIATVNDTSSVASGTQTSVLTFH